MRTNGLKWHDKLIIGWLMAEKRSTELGNGIEIVKEGK